MCLINCPEQVISILESKEKEITCYKILEKSVENNLFSLHYPIQYRPGIIKSDANYLRIGSYGAIINKGIHVYRTLKLATYIYARIKSNCQSIVIVKVTGKKEDLLGANLEEMVFSKVTLDEEEYKHVLDE